MNYLAHEMPFQLQDIAYTEFFRCELLFLFHCMLDNLLLKMHFASLSSSDMCCRLYNSRSTSVAGGKNCLILLVTLDHDEIYEIDILSCAQLGMGR